MTQVNKMAIWDDVCKTDPSFTKRATQRGGYTSIDAQYQLKLATEAFGPYGSGFGLCESEFDYSLVESGLIIHKAVFFYHKNGRYEFPISNAIQAVITYKNGEKRADPDFAKKLETNTVTKALSKLGFNADIFLGMFEDQDYVYETASEFQVEKAENEDEEKERQYKEIVENVKKQVDVMKTCNSPSQYMPIYKQIIRRLNLRAHDKRYQALIARVEAVRKELEEPKDE